MGTLLRVLIVEDSEEDTLLIVRELKRGGFETIHERVETAEGMKVALSAKTWDLILADYSMPHFSGLEALKLSKESELDLPFIIVSGSIGEDVAVEAMKSGAHDYLMKNNLTRLIPAIQQELREAEVRRKLKHSEKALQEAEKRYRQVVENATEIIYAVDEKGNFTYGNPAGLKVTGYSLEELRKLNFADLVLPEHRERVKDIYSNQFRQRIPATYVEFPFIGKAGEIIWFGQNSALVMEGDKIVGFHMIARDITERKRAEEALRASEERYRSLFENMLDGYAYCKMLFEQGRPHDFIYLDVNPAFETLTGLKNAAGKKVSELIPGIRESNPEVFEIYGRVALTGKGERFETYVPPLGIWFSVSVFSPARDYFVAVFDNITERKRAEEALRESEQRYRNLVENAADVIFTLAPDGTITSVNPAFETITGWSGAEWLHKQFAPMLHPDDLSQGLELFQHVLKGERIAPSQLRTLTKSGDYLVAEFTVAPQIQNGSVIGILGIGRDITEHKKAEEALKKSEEKFKELYDDAPIGYFEYNTDGYITSVNRTELEMLGYSLEEMIGRPPWKFIVEEDIARQQILAKLAGTMPPVRGFERTYRRKDGTTFPAIVEDRLIPDSGGKIKGIRATIQDITERKRAEEEKVALVDQLRQSQKMEAIGRLAGGVAHDFNNLLTVIKGYCQLSLAEMKESTPLKDTLEVINKAAEKAAGLTRQLLAFGRRQIMEVKILDLNTLLQNLDKMLRRLISEDIELVTLLGEDLGRVKTDPGQIEQVVINLAVNAKDAMSKGGKLIIETANVELDESYARAHVAVTPGRYVMIAVSDTGTGMAPEVRDRVFEPFFTTKGKGKGTGLGLSTVYGIVKQSGGNIWVYSEPGQGTTLKIYLPRFDEPAEELKTQEAGEEFPRGSETILIVEDDKEVRNLAVQILKRQGYTVLDGSYGDKAFNVCRQHKGPIHLLVTDVVMPGMDGRVLSESLSQLHPEMKVLYMSGYTDDAIIHHGMMEKGMNFIQKPFTVNGLTNKVREVLDQSRQH